MDTLEYGVGGGLVTLPVTLAGAQPVHSLHRYVEAKGRLVPRLRHFETLRHCDWGRDGGRERSSLPGESRVEQLALRIDRVRRVCAGACTHACHRSPAC